MKRINGDSGMDNKTILIIEDDMKNTKLMRVILEREGYRILNTTEARAGIDMAREHKPFLILMDIQLHGTDGLEATRLIQQDSALKGIPVIALTAFAMKEDASFKSMKDDPRLIALWNRLGERMAVERQWYEAHKDDPL